jgi:hypothetical protein
MQWPETRGQFVVLKVIPAGRHDDPADPRATGPGLNIHKVSPTITAQINNLRRVEIARRGGTV